MEIKKYDNFNHRWDAMIINNTIVWCSAHSTMHEMHVKRAGGAWKRIRAQLPGTGRLSTTNTKSNSGVSQYSLCYSYQWEHQPPKQYLWYVYFNFDNFGSSPSSRCSAPWSAKSSIPPILPISSRESLSPPVLSLRLLTLSLPRSNTTIYVRLSLRSRGTISWGAQISSLKPTRLDCFCVIMSTKKALQCFLHLVYKTSKIYLLYYCIGLFKALCWES